MRWFAAMLAVAGLTLVTLSVGALVPGTAQAADRLPLPVGTHWDYQLGGARPVPASVGVVLRDRRATPVRGRYNICYVNAFQTQPDEGRFWRTRQHLILKRDGRPVVDSAWGEKLLDLRTPAKRRALAHIVGAWMSGCARAGFDAVELDNLDSFSRSRRLITPRQTKAYAALLTRRAHRSGLSVAQKNWPALDGRRIGFDFAVAEECARWHECGAYAAHYGRRVLVVEYRDRDFRRACHNQGRRLSVLRRDLALSRTGVRRWC
ncbi:MULTISPECIES: endo alpha-1,4 polygalactosaminidase [unclassified Nocardioides]|uniref:endo alpha-1,4 polygalactosaminidase n=1 Tax=unclassified Nocardioides TaxID=2615069 RepID=UPI0006F7AFDD|nr:MULTISPECIES: endo alpha-1,4 polygalactosaminidase [unclassified Nocardioides]KQY63627.1 hypothetical protein ASD30_01050 [Nocardioides sp. Root140]KRF15643.1 hypothetical protein ASH02_03045 [Nocardioides sp. Soil796]